MTNAKRKTQAPRSRVGGALAAWMTASPSTEAAPSTSRKAPPSADEPRPLSVPAKRRKSRATWDVAPELLEECRDAVVALAGPPLSLNMSTLVEGALRRELDRLAREFNKARPFPKRRTPVRTGRPVT